MTETRSRRRRAPGMGADERREMIIRAAVPLVAEYGSAVTTSKVARAAGIGEATIFRVFKDKEELLEACVAEATRSDHVVRELSAIPMDQALTARLVEAAGALRAHLDRLGAVAGALQSMGRDGGGGHGDERRIASREEPIAGVRRAVADLLEPEAPQLRLPAERLAALFIGLLFSLPRVGGDLEVTPEELVGTFLHGALTAPGAPA